MASIRGEKLIDCWHCGHSNPADAQFCQNCGRSLALVCPNCGTANQADARFCKQCGQPLEKTSETQSAHTHSIRTPVEDSVAERRIVTVLFCDVVGSTALGAQLDPEEWTEIMNGMFERLVAAVIRYDGTIARLMGDAILALFGAPVSHEDDAYRAVLAGLDMLQDIRPYQRRVRQRLMQASIQFESTDFEVRVGINTGLVVVGRVGSDLGQEYTAMGDAVNLAARMEQSARPGTIQIGHNTYRAVAQRLDVEPLGLVKVKGKKDPVRAYRVLGAKEKADRPRGPEGVDAPLVGREQEMKLLREARDNLLAGSGGIICLIGEAGLGKSRLIHEFKKLSASSAPTDDSKPHLGEQILWYEGESLSFETAQPYGLLRRFLQRMSAISRSDSSRTVQKKINQLLRGIPEKEGRQVGRTLAALFALADVQSQTQLMGEDLRRQVLDATVTLLRAQTTVGPLVLFIEDLHWADPASVELIERVLDLTEELPLLLLFAFRPYRQSPAWHIKQMAESELAHRYLEIRLRPLAAKESRELASSLLNFSELPLQVEQLILEKTDGVPFFVEEIVSELVEQGALVPADDDGGWHLASEVGDIHVSGNLETVLVARIDRLDRAARRTLQLASVIGRTFSFRLLGLVANASEHLETHMGELQQARMIREVRRYPEREYMFRHVLTQEAAYNTILLKRRRQYHQRVGEAMERLFADQIEEQAPLLAHHFQAAQEYERAYKYFSIAAERAARLYANDEAVMHYSQALDAAGHIDLDDTALADLHRGRGLALETLGEFDRARDDHEWVLKSARALGERKLEWRAMLELGMLWASRDYERTQEYFSQALSLARRMENPVVLARSLNRTANWYLNAEQPGTAVEYHREALEIFERLQDDRGEAETLDLLGMANIISGKLSDSVNYYDRAIAKYRQLDDRIGLVASLTGRGNLGPLLEGMSVASTMSPQETMSYVEEALRLSQEIGWRAGESFAYWSLGAWCIVIGQYDRALDAIHQGLNIAADIGHRQWMVGNQYNLGMAYLHLLASEAAVQHLQDTLDLAKQIQSQYWINLVTGSLAKAYLNLGDLDSSQLTLEAALTPQTAFDTTAKRYLWSKRAELSLAQGEPEPALDIVDRITSIIPDLSPDNVLPTLWLLRAKVLAALGQKEEVEALLHAALASARESEERNLLWRIHASLGKLYLETNRLAEGNRELERAREQIEKIAGTVPDEALKATFLSRAQDVLVTPAN